MPLSLLSRQDLAKKLLIQSSSSKRAETRLNENLLIGLTQIAASQNNLGFNLNDLVDTVFELPNQQMIKKAGAVIFSSVNGEQAEKLLAIIIAHEIQSQTSDNVFSPENQSKPVALLLGFTNIVAGEYIGAVVKPTINSLKSDPFIIQALNNNSNENISESTIEGFVNVKDARNSALKLAKKLIENTYENPPFWIAFVCKMINSQLEKQGYSKDKATQQTAAFFFLSFIATNLLEPKYYGFGKHEKNKIPKLQSLLIEISKHLFEAVQGLNLSDEEINKPIVSLKTALKDRPHSPHRSTSAKELKRSKSLASIAISEKNGLVDFVHKLCKVDELSDEIKQSNLLGRNLASLVNAIKTAEQELNECIESSGSESASLPSSRSNSISEPSGSVPGSPPLVEVSLKSPAGDRRREVGSTGEGNSHQTSWQQKSFYNRHKAKVMIGIIILSTIVLVGILLPILFTQVPAISKALTSFASNLYAKIFTPTGVVALIVGASAIGIKADRYRARAYARRYEQLPAEAPDEESPQLGQSPYQCQELRPNTLVQELNAVGSFLGNQPATAIDKFQRILESLNLSQNIGTFNSSERFDFNFGTRATIKEYIEYLLQQSETLASNPSIKSQITSLDSEMHARIVSYHQTRKLAPGSSNFQEGDVDQPRSVSGPQPQQSSFN